MSVPVPHPVIANMAPPHPLNSHEISVIYVSIVLWLLGFIFSVVAIFGRGRRVSALGSCMVFWSLAASLTQDFHTAAFLGLWAAISATIALDSRIIGSLWRMFGETGHLIAGALVGMWGAIILGLGAPGLVGPWQMLLGSLPLALFVAIDLDVTHEFVRLRVPGARLAVVIAAAPYVFLYGGATSIIVLAMIFGSALHLGCKGEPDEMLPPDERKDGDDAPENVPPEIKRFYDLRNVGTHALHNLDAG